MGFCGGIQLSKVGANLQLAIFLGNHING